MMARILSGHKGDHLVATIVGLRTMDALEMTLNSVKASSIVAHLPQTITS